VRIEHSVSIARDVADVWAFVADARNDPRWCHKVDSVEQTGGTGPGPDARYRVLHRPRPGKPPVELSMDVVEFDPPRRLRWREQDPDAVFDVLYELESTGTGTLLRQIDEIEWGIPRPLRPIGRLMVSRDIRKQLASLRTLLEEGSTASPDVRS
jgi:uncharacterized protein YndB with AHSA1/START domain